MSPRADQIRAEDRKDVIFPMDEGTADKALGPYPLATGQPGFRRLPKHFRET